MGFLYSPSCVAAYKLNGNMDARKAALLAADQLIARYHPVGEFIQAGGGDGCAGELSPDHRLPAESAVIVLGVGGNRRRQVLGDSAEAHPHSGKECDPGGLFHLAYLLL